MKNKYFQKASLSEIVITAKDWLDANIPSVARPYVESRLGMPIQGIPTTKEDFMALVKDRTKKKVTDTFIGSAKGNMSQSRYTDQPLVGNKKQNYYQAAQDKENQETAKILNRASTVIKNDTELSASIRNASEVSPRSARAFVARSNVQLPDVLTPQDISQTFSDKEVLGLMATSKTSSELNHKIRAGIVLDRMKNRPL